MNRRREKEWRRKDDCAGAVSVYRALAPARHAETVGSLHDSERPLACADGSWFVTADALCEPLRNERVAARIHENVAEFRGKKLRP